MIFPNLFKARLSCRKWWLQIIEIRRSDFAGGRNNAYKDPPKNTEGIRESIAQIHLQSNFRKAKAEIQSTQSREINEPKNVESLTGRNGEVLYEMNIPKSSADLFREQRINIKKSMETQAIGTIQKLNEKNYESNNKNDIVNKNRFQYIAGLLAFISASYLLYSNLRNKSATAALENNISTTIKKASQSNQSIEAAPNTHQLIDQIPSQLPTKTTPNLNKPIWLTDKK